MISSTKSSKDIDLFFSQTILTSIIPKIKIKRLDLADGSFGPFLINRKIDIPLWLAQLLHSSDKCTVLVPDFLTQEFLEQVHTAEQEATASLTSMLPEYFFEIAQIFLTQYFQLLCNFNRFVESFVKPEKIRILVQNIRDIRQGKIDTLVLARMSGAEIPAVGMVARERSEIRIFMNESFVICDEMQAQYDNFNVREQVVGNQKMSFSNSFSSEI